MHSYKQTILFKKHVHTYAFKHTFKLSYKHSYTNTSMYRNITAVGHNYNDRIIFSAITDSALNFFEWNQNAPVAAYLLNTFQLSLLFLPGYPVQMKNLQFSQFLHFYRCTLDIER